VVPILESGGVCVWWESGVRRSVLCWCIRQESGFSCREDVFTLSLIYFKKREPGSSVSIVSGYGLDDRAIEVRTPAEAKGFFL
jgi:hypothetical protein